MNSKLPLAERYPNDGARDPGAKNVRSIKRIEATARFERMWLNNPEQFNPLRNCLEKERVERCWKLLLRNVPHLEAVSAVDLGSGWGYLALKLSDLGATVDLVDISSNALKRLQGSLNEKCRAIQDLLPQTKLEDNSYDVVISTELIGHLAPGEHRLYISELARLVKGNGTLLCSTDLDIDSDGAVQLFARLVESEFEVVEWQFSYHRLYIAVKKLLSFPEKMARSAKDSRERERLLAECNSSNRWWYRFNSAKYPALFWKVCSYPLRPLTSFWRNSRWTLLKLETVCRWLWSDGGISHAAFIGKRRPLPIATSEELMAIEKKHKKQVWE